MEGKGYLKIEITEEDDVVYFCIEDNGIGRTAAIKLQEGSVTKHKSMGLLLTRERLELINENRDITFTIEDLMDGNKPTGTKVTIGVVA